MINLKQKNPLIYVLILAVVITVGFSPIISNAEDTSYKYDNIEVKFGEMYYMNYNSKYNPEKGNNNGLGFFGNSYKYFTIDGTGHYPAYCIESNVSTNDGERVDIKETLTGVPGQYQTAIKAIIDADLNDFSPNKIKLSTIDIGVADKVTINDKSVNMKEYCIKQYAIWYILDELGQRSDAWSPVKGLNACITTPGYINDIPDNEFAKKTNVYMTKESLYNAVKYIKGLVDASMDSNSKIVPKEAKFTITDKITFDETKDGCYTSNEIVAVATGSTDGKINYNVKCTDAQKKRIKYQRSEGKSNGVVLKIEKKNVVPGTTIDVSIEADVMMKAKIYGYCEPQGKTQKLVTAIAETTTSKITAETKGTINRETVTGEVEINKVDSETGEGLKGAEFELTYTSGGSVVSTTKASMDEGLLKFENLPVGYNDEKIEYTLTEIKAPDEYEEFNLFTTKFALTEKNNKKSFSTENGNAVKNNKKIYGQVDIIKVDAEDPNIALEGAEFTLYDDTRDVIVTKASTNADGFIEVKDLDVYGINGEGCDYILTESKAPKGYSLDYDNIYTERFTLSKYNDSHSMSFTVANKKMTVLGITEDPGVLGDEDFPGGRDEGRVLGEEAKTSDLMNAVPGLMALLLVSVATLFIFLVRRILKRSDFE